LPDAALALVLARMPAFFDLFACGLAGMLLFPGLFFPGCPWGFAVLAGLAIAVLPLAASPLGGRLAMTFSRRHGRGVALTAGNFVLGASTTTMAVRQLAPAGDRDGAAGARRWAVR
jgi:hypothetical protein